MTLEEAREKGREWLKLIARGIDPAEHERELQLAAARRRENSFASVFEDFAKEKLAGERQGRDVERDMRKEFVTVWAKRPVSDITTADVLAIIRTIKQRAPSQARNLFGYVRRFFDWVIEQHAYGITINPCAGLKPARLIGEKKSPRPRAHRLRDFRLLAGECSHRISVRTALSAAIVDGIALKRGGGRVMVRDRHARRRLGYSQLPNEKRLPTTLCR